MLTEAQTFLSVAEAVAETLAADSLAGSTIHPDTSQNYIFTTEDKLRLRLIEYRRILKSQSDWKTPAGLFAGLLATLVAADFKELLEIQKEAWRAVFLLAAVQCAAWLVYGLFSAWRTWDGDHLEALIKNLKVRSVSMGVPRLRPEDDPDT